MTACQARTLRSLTILVAAVGYPMTINSTKSSRGRVVYGADQEARVTREAILLSMKAILSSTLTRKLVKGEHQEARITTEATRLSMSVCQARMLARLMTLEAAVGYPKVQNAVMIDSTTSSKGEVACSADLKVIASSDVILP